MSQYIKDENSAAGWKVVSSRRQGAKKQEGAPVTADGMDEGADDGDADGDGDAEYERM
jgi:hypothetical protein